MDLIQVTQRDRESEESTSVLQYRGDCGRRAAAHKSQIRLRERIPANPTLLPNRPDQRAILDLVKINADVGRLDGFARCG